MSLKEAMKSALTPYPRALRTAQRVYQIPKVVASRFRFTEQHFLDDLVAHGGEVSFLQIGAHDGKTNDPLHPYVVRHGWRGVLVEPVRDLFEQLRRTYAGFPQLAFENAALSDQDGVRTFYRLDSRAPAWCSQLGSFHRNVVLAHKYMLPNFEDYLVEEPVRCVSFRTLVERHVITRLDIIAIDTEGYDLEVLRQIDFVQFRPALVIYEQQHLSPADKRRATDLLAGHGYEIHRVGHGWNNVAVHKTFSSGGGRAHRG